MRERIAQTEDYFERKVGAGGGKNESDYFFVDEAQFVYSRAEWLEILENDQVALVSKKKLRESIMQGIPEELRARIWMFLCKTRQAKSTYKPDVYRKLRLIPNESDDYAIEKDLARTFADTAQFKEVGARLTPSLSRRTRGRTRSSTCCARTRTSTKKWGIARARTSSRRCSSSSCRTKSWRSGRS